ncbi:hypothetical protein OSTOST_22603, partial [Ostertagia ostertagi]
KRLPLQKRVPREECEAPSLNSLSSDLCHLTEPNAATVLDSLSRRYQQNVIHVRDSCILEDFGKLLVFRNYNRLLILRHIFCNSTCVMTACACASAIKCKNTLVYYCKVPLWLQRTSEASVVAFGRSFVRIDNEILALQQSPMNSRQKCVMRTFFVRCSSKRWTQPHGCHDFISSTTGVGEGVGSVDQTYCGLFCVVLNPWRTLPIYTTDVMATYRTGVGDGYRTMSH